MKIYRKEVDVFITEDGKEFLSEEEAREHEKRLKDCSYWIVICNPDLTEGRGWYRKIYLTVYNGSRNLVEDWCYENIGRKTAWVHGVVEIENWRLHKSNPEEFANKFGQKVGDYTYDWEEKILELRDGKLQEIKQ